MASTVTDSAPNSMSTLRRYFRQRFQLEKKAAFIPQTAVNPSLESSPASAGASGNYMPKFQVSESDAAYEKVPVGVDSLVAASKKLLAINRGEIEPDERDSLKFKRVYNVDDLLAERTRMDAGKLRNNIMFKLSKARSLKHLPSGVLDSYMTGHIIGNALSLPSEEINPLYLQDQQSRVTVFGQGGISSPDAVSTEAQNVHPSIFGFLDAVAGPEGIRIGVDARLAQNTRLGMDGRLYTRVRNKRTGKLVWLTPDELETATIAFAH